MIRCGAAPEDMGPLSPDDLFISRLKLLIIMSKAYLEGYPLGEERARAVIENARAITLDITDWFGGEFENYRAAHAPLPGNPIDHFFYQRVKLLTVMAKGFASGNPMGEFRKQALRDNIEEICCALTFDHNLTHLEILQVA